MKRIKKLDEIIEEYKKVGDNKPILIMGRYKHDVYNYLTQYRRTHFIISDIYIIDNHKLYSPSRYYFLNTDGKIFEFLKYGGEEK